MPGPSPVLADLERKLDSEPSATRALTAWCGERGMAGGDAPRITAARQRDRLPLPPDGRALLALGPDEAHGFRHVRLACNGIVLSEAYNWYVPARLSEGMKAELAATGTPFGTVVAPLRFSRTALASARGRGAGCPRGTVLSRRALLRLPDGRALALLVECYTAATIARGA
ncbi:MAG: hypothetical protein KGM17_05355 [Sphingomonadales bacterium]|nr:hypothetical protein [Sphingomonadales bacterium]